MAIEDTMFADSEQALRYIEQLGLQTDDDIDLYEGALALSLQEHPGKSVDQYRQHLNKLVQQAQDKLVDLQEEDGLDEDSLDAKVQALRHVLNRLNGYKGDDQNYEDLQNADLIRVIDRRLGLPIALGIIAIALGQKLGWSVSGLTFPAHFLIRLDGPNGQRAILDPFNMFADIEAHSMRVLLKEKMGEEAELSSHYYDAASMRGILLRLQNNIKYRLIEAEDYTKALEITRLMRLFAPDDYRLLFDEGILLARLDHTEDAVQTLRCYIEKAPSGQDRMQALGLVNELVALLS